MNRWKLFILVFSVAVNVAVLGTLIYFWTRPNRPVEARDLSQREKYNSKLLLGDNPLLSPEQKQELKQLRKRYHGELRGRRQYIAQQRADLVRYLLNDPPMLDSIYITLDSVAEKQKQLEKITIQHLLSMRKHIDKEQWETMIQTFERPPRLPRGWGSMKNKNHMME